MESEWRNLRSLAQIGQVVNSSLELEKVLQMVMDTIIQMTGAERGFLMLRNPANVEMDVRVARNWEQESINPHELNISQTVLRRVLTDGQPVLTTDALEDPRFGNQESVVIHNLRSILCVPVMVKRDLIGLIYADNRVRTGLFTRRHLELLTGFANQAGVAIENARLFDSVRATLAEVTELKNLMDNVFASIPSGVLTTDVEERIQLCNRAAGEILGWAHSDLVGRNLKDAFPELQSTAQTVLNEGHTVLGLDIHPEFPHRGTLDLRLSLSPIQDDHRATHGLAVVLEDMTETRRLEARQNLFARMVSPAVIDQIDPNGLKTGGQRREITTLFADLRGFTSLSERVEPEELVAVLNRYLAVAADAILKEGGTIDKFLGDAVMAWFNAPLPQPDHTLCAVRAALAMREAVARLNTTQGRIEQMSFGVGIHVGDAVLGLVGTEKRLDYTAIGDSVNIARRIQENAGAGQILISKHAYERVSSHVVAGEVFPLRAYGKKDPVVVVEINSIR
jgi:adenylate cyclase